MESFLFGKPHGHLRPCFSITKHVALPGHGDQGPRGEQCVGASQIIYVGVVEPRRNGTPWCQYIHQVGNAPCLDATHGMARIVAPERGTTPRCIFSIPRCRKEFRIACTTRRSRAKTVVRCQRKNDLASVVRGFVVVARYQGRGVVWGDRKSCFLYINEMNVVFLLLHPYIQGTCVVYVSTCTPL